MSFTTCSADAINSPGPSLNLGVGGNQAIFSRTVYIGTKVQNTSAEHVLLFIYDGF